MPSSSKKQHNLMMAVAHSPKFAKKVGIKQSVGKDFAEADKGRRFGTGGDVNRTIGGQGMINKQRTRFGSTLGFEKNVPNINLNKYTGKKEGGIVDKKELAEDKKLIKKAFGMHDKQEHKGSKTDLSKLKKGGCAKKMAKGGKAKDVDVKIAMMKNPQRPAPRAAAPAVPPQGAGQMMPQRPPMVPGGAAMGGAPAMKKGGKAKCMASGGLAAGHKTADGIAQKGKTKARTVTMCGGGKTKKYC